MRGHVGAGWEGGAVRGSGGNGSMEGMLHRHVRTKGMGVLGRIALADREAHRRRTRDGDCYGNGRQARVGRRTMCRW